MELYAMSEEIVAVIPISARRQGCETKDMILEHAVSVHIATTNTEEH